MCHRVGWLAWCHGQIWPSGRCACSKHATVSTKSKIVHGWPMRMGWRLRLGQGGGTLAV